MRRDLADPEVQALLDAPSAASLALYAEDGEIGLSPVWFRVNGDRLEVVVALADRKIGLLRRDPRCVLLIVESEPSTRGVQVRGQARLTPDEGSESRLAIASRYLGSEGGGAFADLARRPSGTVVSLPLSSARAWDLADQLP